LLHIVYHNLLLVAFVVVLDNLLNKTDRFLSTPSISISSSAIESGTDTLADETTEEPHADSDQTSDFCVDFCPRSREMLSFAGRGR
jgi:hypothetical protein